ncbi:MAG: nitroreductase family protein [Thermoplasmata archaeon]|nr:nitroreductase family protein [Thermoplasmata archaeon]
MSATSATRSGPSTSALADRDTSSEILRSRPTESGVSPWFVNRWSPRAFTDEPVDPEELQAIFEAARWAPSSSNEQPWLFVYAQRPEDRARLLPGLHPYNQAWAVHAPVLIYLFARRHLRSQDQGPVVNAKASFDAGAAWMSIALQAELFGLSAHAMGGILPERVYELTGVPETEYEVMAAIVLGHRGDARRLPAAFAEREHPSPRRPLDEIVRESRTPPTADELVA